MNKKIIVALDSNNINKTKYLASKLKNEVFAFKIGYEFFLNFGLYYLSSVNLGLVNHFKKLANKLKKAKFVVDIGSNDGILLEPLTKNGIKAIEKLGPILTTIHISGGDEMQKFSVFNKKRKVKILGVSILTSLNSIQTKKYYNEANIEKLVKNFVKFAQKNKLDGIVCSPLEIKIVRKILGEKLLIVVPGIRPKDYIKKNDDQKRFVTPKEAINSGADLLVIGRPITDSKDPLKIIKKINKSIN